MRRLALVVATIITGAMVFTTPAAAGGGCHGSGDVTAGRGYKASSLVIEGCMFTPTVVYVDPGAKVTWVNKDHLPHTVSGVNDSWGTPDTLDKGDHVTYAFKNEGVFPYYCLLHPSMVGAVVVGDPAASKAAAAPVEADVEMLTGSNVDDGVPPETEQAAVPVASTSSADDAGAPWLLVALIGALGVAAGATMRTVRRTRAPSFEA